MRQLFFATLLLTVLSSCATAPPPLSSADPCSAGEATYACQVQRYRDAT